MELRFFELLDHIGVDPITGELEPLKEQGLVIGRAELVGGKPRTLVQAVRIFPVEPGSRTVSTDDEAIAQVLERHPFYREVDLPIGLRPRRPRILVPAHAKEA